MSPRSQQPACSPTTRAMSKNPSIISSPNSQLKPKHNLQSRYKWHKKKKRSIKLLRDQYNQANTLATIQSMSHQSKNALDWHLISLSVWGTSETRVTSTPFFRYIIQSQALSKRYFNIKHQPTSSWISPPLRIRKLCLAFNWSKSSKWCLLWLRSAIGLM